MACFGKLRKADNGVHWMSVDFPVKVEPYKEGSPFISLTPYKKGASDIYEDYEALMNESPMRMEVPAGIMPDGEPCTLPVKVSYSAYLVRSLTDDEKIEAQNKQRKLAKGAAIARDESYVEKLASDANIAGTDAKSMLTDKLTERMIDKLFG